MMEHEEIARWAAGHPGRKVKIRCIANSAVSPWPADLAERTDGNDGVWWAACASVGGVGQWVHARTLDAAFAGSLCALVLLVLPSEDARTLAAAREAER